MKLVKEWTFETTWGKIAMISWGDPWKPPVLLVHGYMDTAATFIPLTNLLSDKYYYVAFDIPGHGKSDPFPPGLTTSKLVIVEAFKRVIKHMKWKKFHFLAHSMGCIIGLFYNHLYPGQIESMILLDFVPPLSMYYYINEKFSDWLQYFYLHYYENYDKWNTGNFRIYKYEEAISLMVRNRNVTEDKAEILLSRALVKLGDDSYKLSWEPRMKKISTIPVSQETLFAVLTSETTSTPILSLEASESDTSTTAREYAENLVQKANRILPDFTRVTVTGSHDVHLTDPEQLVPIIEKFWEKNINMSFWSKL